VKRRKVQNDRWLYDRCVGLRPNVRRNCMMGKPKMAEALP